MKLLNVGSMVVAVAVTLFAANTCWALTLPYSTGFESPEWTATGAWSDAPGQNGWTGASTTVLSDAGKAYQGDQCLRFGFWNGYGGWMKTPEITGELETGLLEIEVMLNHGNRDGVAGDSAVKTNANDGYNMFDFRLSASSGYFEANGTSTGVAFAENTWYKINLVIDQGTNLNGNKMNCYVDDDLVAENVPSLHWASTGLKYVELSGGKHAGGGATGDSYTYMDNLVIAIPEPMTMTLLVIGGLCGVVRKRRRA